MLNAESLSMKKPLLDLIGFTALVIYLAVTPHPSPSAAIVPVVEWIIHYEPIARSVGSYGAATIAIWRGVVLVRRGWIRWQVRRAVIARRKS